MKNNSSMDLDKPEVAGMQTDEGFIFPKFVGHRRWMVSRDDVFQESLFQRDEISHQKYMEVAQNESRSMQYEQSLTKNRDIATHFSHRFECETCHASLPTAHLLDLHIQELHDSFFAAQASRRLPVYRCLLESCSRKFRTIEERRQHLWDHHQFPKNYQFDRIHLRRRKGQIRPLPQYQKVGNSSKTNVPDQTLVDSKSSSKKTESMNEEVVVGLSRLQMAAQTSQIPSVLSFGRRRTGLGVQSSQKTKE